MRLLSTPTVLPDKQTKIRHWERETMSGGLMAWEKRTRKVTLRMRYTPLFGIVGTKAFSGIEREKIVDMPVNSEGN
jgi:hypothetical protein